MAEAKTGETTTTIDSTVSTGGVFLLVALLMLLGQACAASGSSDGNTSPSSVSVPLIDAANAGPSPSTSTPTGPTTTAGVPFHQRVPVLPEVPFSYDTELPDHFFSAVSEEMGRLAVVQFDSTDLENRVTDAGAALGRVLFYDVNFSRGRSVACGSCHLQSSSFTDSTQFSLGVNGFTRRNSMSLANAAFNLDGRFFWDERAAILEDQVLMPFADPIEMGLSVDEVVQRAESKSYYRPLFEAAFGDDHVNADRIRRALAQFVRAMVSVNSRYDEGRAQVESAVEPFPNFTDEENRGKELFITSQSDGGAGCAACHTSEAQLLGTTGPLNNGLDALSVNDLGVFETTGDAHHLGAFRVPSLRNVELTAPYMHDGRFRTLDEVIDHYDEGVQPHQNLSGFLLDDTGRPVRLGLSDEDRAALIAHLETLTDPTFLTDERFRNPFVQN
ncbi:MAG: c-type cytochrome [Actinomycetia bacterium]|nr:c-type cytochrome [Actinomycetes bacterium]